MSRRTRRNRRAPSRGEPSAGSSANEQDEEEEGDNSGAEANAESTSEKETAAPSTRRSKRTRKPTARSVIAAASTHVRRRKLPGDVKEKEEENSTSGDDRDSEEDPSKEPQNSKSTKQSESGDTSDESEKEVQENAAKKRTMASKRSLRGKASSKREKDSKDGDSSDGESDDEPLTKLRVSKRSTPKKESRKGGSKSEEAPDGSEKESKTADTSDEGDGSDDEPLTNLKSAKRTTRKTPTKKSVSNSGAANPDGSEKDSKTVDNLDEDNSDDEPLTKLRAARESKRKGRPKPSEPEADESEKEGSSDKDAEDNKEPLTKSKSGGSSDQDGESDEDALKKSRLSKRPARKRRTKKEGKESLEKDDGDQESADEPDDKEPLTKFKSGGSLDQGDKPDENPPKTPRASKLSARTRQTKKGRQESTEADNESDDDQGSDNAPPKKTCASRREAAKPSRGSESAGGESSDEGKESADEEESDEDAAEKPKESDEEKSAGVVSEVKKGKVDSSKEQESSGEEDGSGEEEDDPSRDQRKSRRISGRRTRNKGKSHVRSTGPESEESSSKISRSPKKPKRKKASKSSDSKVDESADQDEGSDNDRESELSSSKNKRGSRSSSRKKLVQGSASRSDESSNEDHEGKAERESEKDQGDKSHSSVENAVAKDDKKPEEAGASDPEQESDDEPLGALRSSNRLTQKIPFKKGESSDGQHSDRGDNSGNEPESDVAFSKGERATSRSSRIQKKVDPAGGESSEGGDKSADDGHGSRRSTKRSKRKRLDQEKRAPDEATTSDNNDSLPSNRSGEESEDNRGAGEQRSAEKLETIESSDKGGGTEERDAEEKISETSPPPQEAPEKNKEIGPPPKDSPEKDEQVAAEKSTLPIVDRLQDSMREEDSDKEKSDSGVVNESQAENSLNSTMEMEYTVADRDNPPEKTDDVEEKTDPDKSKIGKDETEVVTPQSRERFSDSHKRDSEAGLPSKTPEVDADTKHAPEGPNEATRIDAERPADETGVDVEFWNSSDADEVLVSEQHERPVDSSTKQNENDQTDLKSEVPSSSNRNNDEPGSQDKEVEDASEPVPENKDLETVESELAPAVDNVGSKTRVGYAATQVMEAPIEEDLTPSPAGEAATETEATEEPTETGKEGPESEDHVVVPVDSEVTGGATGSVVDGLGTKPLEAPQAGENQSEAKVEIISTEVEALHDKEPVSRSPDDIVDKERDAEMKQEGEIGGYVPPKALDADLRKNVLHSPPQEENPGDLVNAKLTRDGTVIDGLKNLTVSSPEDVRDDLTPATPVETKDEGVESGGVSVAKEEEKERSWQENGTVNAVVEEQEGEKEKAPNATFDRRDLVTINSGNEEQGDASTNYKSETAALELERPKEQGKDSSPETKGGNPAGEDVVKISGDRASNAEASTPSFKQDHVRNIGSDPKEILETIHDRDETQREVAEKPGERSGNTDNAVASPENAVLISSNVRTLKNLIERNSQGETENEQSNTHDQEGLFENKLPGEGPLTEKAEQPVPQHLSSVQREASTDNNGDTTLAAPVPEIHKNSGIHFMEVFSSPVRQEDIERSQGTSEEKGTDPKPTGLEVSVQNSTLVEDSDGDNEQFHDAQMELSSAPPSPQVPVDATKGDRSTQDYSPTALAISKLPLSVIHEESHRSDEARIPGLHPCEPQKTISEDVVEELFPEDSEANQEKSLPAALSLDIGGAQESELGTNVEVLHTKIESAPEAAAASSKDQEEEPNRKRSREAFESIAPQGHGPLDLGQDADQGPDLTWARTPEEEKNVTLPGLDGRAEDKEVAGMELAAEALNIDDAHAELPLDTREDDESTIGQAPFEGLDREKLDRVKAALYSEGNRVHRGHGFERLFADYWDALSLRLSDRLSSHTSERCQVAVKTFLKTRKLRRLHNKFVIGLMGRATRQNAPLREVSQHIPVKWRDRVKRCKSERRQRLYAAKSPDRLTEVLKVPSEVTPFYREAWAAEGSFAHLTPFAAREEVENDVQEVLAETPSSSIPGALVIDPLVREIIQEDNMRVTENAIWLLVIAVKEHTKATLNKVVDAKEALENGHILPRTKNYPYTIASTSKALTSGKASPAKPVATAVASKKRKHITSLDICAASTSSHLAGIGSMGGSLSRYAFERCLHSAYDASPMIPEPNFVEVHKFITSEIASAAKKIKLLPVKEVVPSHRPTVSIPSPPVRPFIQSKPPPVSVPPVHFAPPISAPALRKQHPAQPVAAATHAPVPSQPATSGPVPQNEPKADAGMYALRGLGRGAKNLAALKIRAATDTPPLPKGDELPLPVAPMEPDASSNSTATQSQVSPIPTTNTPGPLVSTEQDPNNTPDVINTTTLVPVPVPVPVRASAESLPANAPSETKPDTMYTSEPPVDKAPEPIRPVMQRRGKGFGTKNLAAMRMRSIQRADAFGDESSDKADEEQVPEPENGETGNTDESSKVQEADPKPSEGDYNASLLVKPESKDNPNEKETGNAGGNPQNQTTISQQT